MTRVLISLTLGVLFTSLALDRSKPVMVAMGDPAPIVASNEAEQGWWLLVREQGQWTRWDGPYESDFACFDDTENWHRANPQKVFACVEVK